MTLRQKRIAELVRIPVIWKHPRAAMSVGGPATVLIWLPDIARLQAYPSESYKFREQALALDARSDAYSHPSPAPVFTFYRTI